MADPKEDVLKFVGTIVPMLGAGIQLGTGLAKDLRRTFRIQKEIGSPGKWFFWISRLPLLLANFVLSLVILLALFSLFGGVNKYAAWTKSPFARFCEGLFDQSLWLVLGYFALAVVVYFQILPRMARLIARIYGWFRPEVVHDPGVINSDWEISQAEEARLVNIDRTQCEGVANFLLQLPEAKTKIDYAGAFSASKWGVGSRTNALLIGNVIEGVVHDLPTGNPCKNISWGRFYDTLEAAGEDVWKPKNLENSAAADRVINAIAKADPTLSCLTTEPAIGDAVKKAIARLRKDFLSDASTLPQGRWPKMSFRRARKRLKKFPKMAVASRNPMDVQFLKLAYTADVWPTLDPGPFIFPFSRGIAALLMNAGCLITTQDTESITFDVNFQRLTAFAEQVIVDSVTDLLRGGSAAADSKLRGATDSWAVTRDVDTLLWWLGRQQNGWKLNLAALDLTDTTQGEQAPWRLSGNTLIRA